MPVHFPHRALLDRQGRIIYTTPNPRRLAVKITTYTKFIVALVGALLTTALVTDWGFDLPPWVAGVSALVTALGVFLAKNSPYVQTDDDPELDG